MQTPELRHLAERLIGTVLKSRANATTKKYLGAYVRWQRWAVKNHTTSFPVAVPMFALYLQDVGDRSKSKHAVKEAINAVSWVQSLAGVEPVSQNQLIRSINEGFQRILSRPTVKKEPVTPVMLQEMVDSVGPTPSLSQIRLLNICLLAYAAFLRIDELTKLRCCDISFSTAVMEVNIVASKTDQYRQGHIVPIAQTGNATCPVAMMKRYIHMGNIDILSSSYLFRAIVVTEGKETLRQSGGLSYTRIRELVLRKFQEMGYDQRLYGLHSFRAGGATAAANNPRVSERLFKRHGRWRSENAKDGYVKDSLLSRLTVSKGLGL